MVDGETSSSGKAAQSRNEVGQDAAEREKIKATLRFIHIMEAEGQSVQDITRELNDSGMTLMGRKFSDEIVRLVLIKTSKDGETVGQFFDVINAILAGNQ